MVWRAIRKEERKIAADAESATLELVNMPCPLNLLGLAVAAFSVDHPKSNCAHHPRCCCDDGDDAELQQRDYCRILYPLENNLESPPPSPPPLRIASTLTLTSD